MRTTTLDAAGAERGQASIETRQRLLAAVRNLTLTMLAPLSVPEEAAAFRAKLADLEANDPEIKALAATNPNAANLRAMVKARAALVPLQASAGENASRRPQTSASDETLGRKAEELRASDPEITALAATNPNAAGLRALVKAAMILGR